MCLDSLTQAVLNKQKMQIHILILAAFDSKPI